jgi:hypothetical protein
MAEEPSVVLVVVPSEPEAEMVCELLRNADIACGYRDTEAIDSPLEGFIASGPREILVHADDVEKARSVLAARDA